jgi:DNA-directed RNA polymerase subunit RPC12/RpoP
MSETETHDFRQFAAAPDTGELSGPEAPLQVVYTCETCGRSFDNHNALNGHKKSHTQKKVPCPDCGKLYIEGTGLSVHRKVKHGVESERQRGRNGAPQPGSKFERVACETCGSVMRKDNLPRHMTQVHRQVTVTTETWSVDDIFDSVVSMLWPTGHMPVTAMTPLISWREATAKMLIEVGGHE